MFEDRRDAGKRLGDALRKYEVDHPLVLAIPRGGVEVGYQVSLALKAEFSILIARKLPFPGNPEAGFGAIAEDGSMYLNEDAMVWISESEKEGIIEEQKREVMRRIETLRQGRPLPSLADRTVILVDDGIAMGSTMRAAITLCKHQRAGKIIVAVPVAGASVVEELQKLVDEVVALETPEFFQAVAQVYKHWYDVSDKEVLSIVKRT
ncbi:MAG TPA: phosphoribosyltransferase [Candidatus Thermoplasmatota archaeon]|nr:phosphoribosyltransferase [Candidatus Thermoplasmatota archaeon]